MQELHRDHLTLLCLPELGGRIISLKYDQHELFFVQQEHVHERFSLDQLSDFKKSKAELGFRLWGGDKTWVSPQADWVMGIPPLDLDAAPYDAQETAEGLIMQSPICRETGLQIHREIRMLGNNALDLIETLINHNEVPVNRSVWNVTQLLRPARVEFSCDYSQVKAFENEGESVLLKESLVKQKGDSIQIDCLVPQHFKFGAVPTQGELLTFCDHGILFKRQFAVDPHAQYAHGCAIEVFNSADYNYLEVEVHAPFNRLMPKSFTSLHQHWEFSKSS
jgi:hypothetical protein